MLKNRDIDATKGSILPQFIKYAVPVAIGGLVQMLFNSADMIVLGNFDNSPNSTSVASVGATAAIVSLVVQSAIGLSGGTQVVLAHAFGEKNRDKIRKTVDTSLLLAAAVGVILTAVGVYFADCFLDITKCPAECYQGASVYLKIYFSGIPAILVYNYGSAIIRTSGDTQRPLIYLVACGLLNVVLNFALCFIMEQKVAAVAIATLVSQILGAVLVVARLLTVDNDCKMNFRHLMIDGTILRKILFIGIPSALNSSLYSISNLQIQSAINSFGPSAMAGNTAGTNVESWVSSFVNAVNVTCLTFVGQNIGARNRERIKKSFFVSLLLGFTVGFVLGEGLYIFGHPVLKIFLPRDPAAVEIGVLRMKYVLAVYFIAGLSGVLSNTISAFGYSIIPMMNSIVSVLVLRIFWMTFIFPKYNTLDNLFFCYTVSWIISLAVASLLLTVIMSKSLKKMKNAENEIITAKQN